MPCPTSTQTHMHMLNVPLNWCSPELPLFLASTLRASCICMPTVQSGALALRGLDEHSGVVGGNRNRNLGHWRAAACHCDRARVGASKHSRASRTAPPPRRVPRRSTHGRPPSAAVLVGPRTHRASPDSDTLQDHSVGKPCSPSKWPGRPAVGVWARPVQPDAERAVCRQPLGQRH